MYFTDARTRPDAENIEQIARVIAIDKRRYCIILRAVCRESRDTSGPKSVNNNSPRISVDPISCHGSRRISNVFAIKRFPSVAHRRRESSWI